MGIAERLLNTIQWQTLKSATGSGERIREALLSLLSAENPEAANAAYWRIENQAFIQGELFEVAEACATVLTASLLDPRAPWVRIASLEILFQVLSGYTSNNNNTPEDLKERCVRSVRDGLWLIVREAIDGQRDSAMELLELLNESHRLHLFRD